MSRTFRLAACAALMLTAAPVFAEGPLRFFPVTPCRIIDTRQVGGAISASTSRDFTVKGATPCNIPANAKAVVLNATAVAPTANGYLTLYPAGITRPLASNLNFRGGDAALANGAIVALATGTPDLTAFVFLASPDGTAHLVLDTTGYFCKVDGAGACIP